MAIDKRLSLAILPKNNSDDIGSKRRAITTRPGHVNGVSKRHCLLGDKRYTDLKSRSAFFSVTLGSVHLFIKVSY